MKDYSRLVWMLMNPFFIDFHLNGMAKLYCLLNWSVNIISPLVNNLCFMIVFLNQKLWGQRISFITLYSWWSYFWSFLFARFSYLSSNQENQLQDCEVEPCLSINSHLENYIVEQTMVISRTNSKNICKRWKGLLNNIIGT